MVRPTPSSRPSEAATKRQYVRYNTPGGIGSREISGLDWLRLGSDTATAEDEVTKWDYLNGFRVPREDIPLTDEQLKTYIATDPGLTLIEE
jgi:hypothetical protein